MEWQLIQSPSKGGNRMALTTRPCLRCGTAIPAARLEALPETRLCIKCSEEVGSDFVMRISSENLAKTNSLKKNYGGLNVHKSRRRIEPKED
jgi:RNA polymerase-binding transcription factor DksA